MEDLIERLNSIISKAVESLGYDVWGITFSGTERGGILRVYIDSPHGISISDCTEVSRHLDVILDVEDPIVGPYTLEVSSPGLDRIFFKIEQLKDYVGKLVKIRLKSPVDNRKKWRGRLQAVDLENKDISIEMGKETFRFNWEDIEEIKLIYEWKL